MASLKLFHINKIYDGGVHAVKDFSLDVEDGQFVVFVGPSGCGKSTVLRMIAGLEQISSGDAFIGDRLVNGLPPKERNISMVFQNYALFPNMSVYDNMSYGLRMQGEDRQVIEEKVQRAAKMLNLQDYLYRKPAQLSGGQRQRVALGRAMVRQPDLFLLDEPLSNLDAKLRNKMRSEIMQLHNELGATFVYVTHDQVEAMTMGDKIVVMKDGVVMQTGAPSYLYRHPANLFVAGFLGTPQMNFWQGTVSTENGLAAVCPVGTFPLDGELALRLDEGAKQDGKKIVIGLRPEHIKTVRSSPTDVELTGTIRVVEDFCSYAVFHADVNGAEVVGQDKIGVEMKGTTVTLYADSRALHIFDAETEKSLLPQYAAQKTVSGRKAGEHLHILGGTVELPKPLQNIKDGSVSLIIPAEAIQNGNIPVTCTAVQDGENGKVSLLDFSGEKLYARGDFSGKTAAGLDLSRVEIVGEQAVGAIAEVSCLHFTYKKCKGKDGERKVTKHFCCFGNTEMESYYEFNKKMYRLGKLIFREDFRMDIPVDRIRLAREQESYPCVQAKVLQILDYGTATYTQVAIGNEKSYLRGILPVGATVTLAVDLDHVQVYSAKDGTILF